MAGQHDSPAPSPRALALDDPVMKVFVDGAKPPNDWLECLTR